MKRRVLIGKMTICTGCTPSVIELDSKGVSEKFLPRTSLTIDTQTQSLAQCAIGGNGKCKSFNLDSKAGDYLFFSREEEVVINVEKSTYQNNGRYTRSRYECVQSKRARR